MTTEMTTNENKAGWDAAAKASAEAQRPEPKRREYVEQLRVPLSDKELIKLQDEISDLEKELEAKEEQFDTLKSNHKAEVKAMKARIAEKAQQRRDKHRLRPVKCVEFTSFDTNDRWRVRLDTNEEIGREALSSTDRQQLLYPDDAEDGQLSLGQEGDGGGDGEDFEDFGDDDDATEPDEGTEITNPEKVLGKGKKVKR